MSLPAAFDRENELQSLALDIARNEVGMKLPIEELLQQLGVDPDTFLYIAKDPVFKRQTAQFKKELEENGVSFQLKARIQAEELLKTNWRLVHNPDTPAAVAVKAIENTVRWAGLEPKNNPTPTNAPGTGFSIVFNIPGPLNPADSSQNSGNVIDVTPTSAISNE